MIRLTVTSKDYLTKHIPHRVNVLITFRERYRDPSQAKIDPERYRDLFRCSKDISMLMVRFFLDELGVRLPRKKPTQSDVLVENWRGRHGIRQLTVSEVKCDRRFNAVFEVLKAANRAVAHIDDVDVDHAIKVDRHMNLLFEAIDFTEEKIKEKIYHSDQDTSFETAMALPENDMKRRPD